MRLVAYIGQANRASARAMHGRFTRRRRPERPHHACVTPATISFGGNYIPKGNVVATLSSRSHARDMLLSCFPSQVRLLGQNFTGHVHGTGRDKAARYPVKLTVCETIRTFLQPERPLNRRIRIWHDSYTGPTGQRGTRSHRPDRVRTRYVLFCNPNSRSTDGSEFGMSRTRDRRTTGHPSQRLGKARVTGETGGLHMNSYANPPISHTQAGRSPLLPNIPEGFSPPWDPCPSFVKKGYTVFPRIPVYTFFGPYGRTCIRPCHVHGFHPFSMVRAQFFETRPPCPFFPISSRSRFLARVAVRAPVHATHMVFTSFPWCAPSFLQHGRRTPCFPVSSSSRFLARVPVRSSVHATHMLFTRFPWRAPSFLHHGRRTPFFPVSSRSRFLARVPVRASVHSTHIVFPCSPWCAPSYLQHGLRTRFSVRPVSSYVVSSVRPAWLSFVYHSARPVSSTMVVVPVLRP